MATKDTTAADGIITQTLTGKDGQPDGARVLVWCETHQEPGWLYDDGSWGCMWEHIVETYSDDHTIGTAPWATTT